MKSIKTNAETIRLVDNMKTPPAGVAWSQKCNWSKRSNQRGQNYGVLTGNYATKLGIKSWHNNGFLVLDLDFYKLNEKELEEHPFTTAFGKDYVKAFNTYTVKSHSGGYHLYFQYDDDLASTKKSAELSIDFLGNGSYVVGAGTLVNGRSYECIHDVDVSPMPESLKGWIQANMKTGKRKSAFTTMRGLTEERQSPRHNSYFFGDSFLSVVKGLPGEYFKGYTDWLQFTTFMKRHNAKAFWDKESKRRGPEKYDKTKNNAIWDKADTNIFVDDIIIKASSHPLPQSVYKYRETGTLLTREPDIVIPEKEKYIDENLLTEHSGDIVLKADTGSGKTHAMRKYLKSSGARFISITSRRTLADEHHRVFQKEGIDDIVHYKNQAQMSNLKRSYIVQVDSIMKLAFNPQGYVVFLDECNSLIEYIVSSSTLQHKRVPVMLKFLDVIRKAKRIIAVDADVTDICFTLLEHCQREIKFVWSKKLHNESTPARELKTSEALYSHIKTQEKFLIASDSATEARTLYHRLKREDPEDTVVLLTADENTTRLDFDAHPRIIFSPTVVYGIDSQMERPVYCVYQGKTISPSAMLQQVNRCRNITKLYYFFCGDQYFYPFAWSHKEAFKTDYMSCYHQSVSEFGLLGESMSALFNTLLIDTEYKNECYKTNKYVHFKRLLAHRGFEDSFANVNKMSTTNADTQKENRTLAKEERLKGMDCYNSLLNLEYLQIPEEEIKKGCYSDLFTEAHKLQEHWNVCYLMWSSQAENFDKLKKTKDCAIPKFMSDLNKVKHAQALLKMVGGSLANPNVVRTDITAAELQTEFDQYKQVFRFRGKETTVKNIKAHLAKVLNHISSSLVDTDKTSSNGKKRSYHNSWIATSLEYHRKVLSFRNPLKITDDIDFVD